MGGPDERQVGSSIDQARRALGEGDLASAERLCDELLRALPSHAEGLLLRGLVALEQGELGRAASWLERAKEASPASAAVRLALGRLFRAEGDLDRAETELCAALEAAPDQAAASFELARIGSLRGDLEAALRRYERAARDPALRAAAHFNRASLLHRSDRLVEAAQAYELAIAASPADPRAVQGLARVLFRLGRTAEARTRYEELRVIDPGCAEAAHMAAALGGERTRGCPPGYVAQLFDDHAERFEALLVDELGYSTHRALADLVWDERPSAHFERVLDLGCGTGLFGVEIRPAARWLGGVDLSARMLAKAAEKGLYDELHQGELPGWLAEHESKFDLLAAADVLPYFGDLERLVVGLRRAAAPAALVALSVESTSAHPYELRRSGRFAHHPSYLASLARAEGLRLLRDARPALRREAGELVDGFLALFEAI